MSNKDEKLINEIEKIRVRNNRHWMNILRIAFRTDPKKAKEIMNSITFNDKKISQLTAQLGE